jgi:toxin FitB
MDAGRLEAMTIAKGHNPGLADILIAATGIAHQLTVLTRNLRHFEPLDVPCLDPFKGLP